MEYKSFPDTVVRWHSAVTVSIVEPPRRSWQLFPNGGPIWRVCALKRRDYQLWQFYVQETTNTYAHLCQHTHTHICMCVNGWPIIHNFTFGWMLSFYRNFVIVVILFLYHSHSFGSLRLSPHALMIFWQTGLGPYETTGQARNLCNNEMMNFPTSHDTEDHTISHSHQGKLRFCWPTSGSRRPTVVVLAACRVEIWAKLRRSHKRQETHW